MAREEADIVPRSAVFFSLWEEGTDRSRPVPSLGRQRPSLALAATLDPHRTPTFSVESPHGWSSWRLWAAVDVKDRGLGTSVAEISHGSGSWKLRWGSAWSGLVRGLFLACRRCHLTVSSTWQRERQTEKETGRQRQRERQRAASLTSLLTRALIPL